MEGMNSAVRPPSEPKGSRQQQQRVSHVPITCCHSENFCSNSRITCVFQLFHLVAIEFHLEQCRVSAWVDFLPAFTPFRPTFPNACKWLECEAHFLSVTRKFFLYRRRRQLGKSFAVLSVRFATRSAGKCRGHRQSKSEPTLGRPPNAGFMGLCSWGAFLGQGRVTYDAKVTRRIRFHSEIALF